MCQNTYRYFYVLLTSLLISHFQADEQEYYQLPPKTDVSSTIQENEQEKLSNLSKQICVSEIPGKGEKEKISKEANVVEALSDGAPDTKDNK